MSQPKGVRPPVILQLRERLDKFLAQEWSSLGRDEAWRKFNILAYTIESLFATYSIIHLFYQLNFNILDLKRLPLWNFYRQDIVPFLAHPLILIGIKPHSIYESLLVLAGVGGSL